MQTARAFRNEKWKWVSLILILIAFLIGLGWASRSAPVFYFLAQLGLTDRMVIGQYELDMQPGWFVHFRSDGTDGAGVLGPQFEPRPGITLTKMTTVGLKYANQIIVTDLTKRSLKKCDRALEKPESPRQQHAWGTAVIADTHGHLAILPDYCLSVAAAGGQLALTAALSDIVAIKRIKGAVFD
jgi:hypothetical protein